MFLFLLDRSLFFVDSIFSISNIISKQLCFGSKVKQLSHAVNWRSSPSCTPECLQVCLRNELVRYLAYKPRRKPRWLRPLPLGPVLRHVFYNVRFDPLTHANVVGEDCGHLLEWVVGAFVRRDHHLPRCLRIPKCFAIFPLDQHEK